MDQLSPEQVSEFQKTFCLFDKDGNGVITAGELGTVMRGLGQNPTEASLNEMIEEVDEGRDGTVNFQEFCNLMVRQMSSGCDQEQKLMDAFKLFDRDGNGLISAEELKVAMCNMGEPLQEHDVLAMMKEADINGDGFVNYEEFVRIMVAPVAQ